MMRLLVTGASGLLGLNFCLKFHDKYEIIGVCNRNSIQNVPFEIVHRDFFHDSVEHLLDSYRPDVILHCAANANIDACEKKPDEARMINGELPGMIAGAAAERGVKLVHISTDAVFDGVDSGSDGYRETDAPHPINKYAETKLLGEQNVLAMDPDALVARVNFYGWSVSGYRSLGEIFYHNLAEGKKMKGFTDVFFTTLYIGKLAEILDRMIELDARGLYHVFSSEVQSKYEFGLSIARRFGLDESLLSPVSWKDGGLAALRSPNLRMNTEKLRSLLGMPLPTQAESLEAFVLDFESRLPQRLSNMIC